VIRLLNGISGSQKSANIPTLSFQNQKGIGVYLHRGFGNVRYRLLRCLGFNEDVFCVVELYYPKAFEGIRVGIPWSVIRKEMPRGISPLTAGEGG